ncbi:MAG: class B sortase [Lachnospiraceae bacterium]|jgi:sortase B|nr:class B sortase [Lachnospiraceae bacterium]MCI1726174.1 class B sortase [Lachnospiraceae bacterium]
MDEMKTAGQKLIRGMNRVLDTAVAIALTVVLLYGGYALWDTYSVYNKTAVSGEIMHFKPDISNPTLSELQAVNEDVCAWLTIDGTHIDYPVLHGTDNSEYLNKNIYDEYSLGGSIFLDCQNKPDFTDFYSLLYGHHMDGGAMFGDVKNFEQADYFDSHRTGTLIASGKSFRLEIAACMHVDAYDTYMFTPGVPTGTGRQALLSYIQKNALHYRETGIDTDSRILALSTCSSATTNGRTIIVARMSEEKDTGGRG